MKILGIIPARSGSKGITDKNVQPLLNKPLIWWTISEAKKAALDRVIVSTDSIRYKDMLEQYGPELFPFLRPEKYAKDKTPSSDVIIHALDWLEKNEGVKYDMLVLLEPTSPMRTAEQINAGIERLKLAPKARALVSVCEQPNYNPLIAFEIGKDDRLVPFGDSHEFPQYPNHPQRQAMRPAYYMSGDLYISYVDTYRKYKSFNHEKSIAFVVPAYQAVEVDYPHDLIMVEALMKARLERRLQ